MGGARQKDKSLPTQGKYLWGSVKGLEAEGMVGLGISCYRTRGNTPHGLGWPWLHHNEQEGSFSSHFWRIWTKGNSGLVFMLESMASSRHKNVRDSSHTLQSCKKKSRRGWEANGWDWDPRSLPRTNRRICRTYSLEATQVYQLQRLIITCFMAYWHYA